MDQQTEQRIRQLAYELWVAADKPEGSHLKFWGEAKLLVAAMDKAGRASEQYVTIRVEPTPVT